jgi:hypothetical protein
MTVTEESPFVAWAENELRRAGLFDRGSDYDGMIGKEVLKLCKAFSGAGHSGLSAAMTASIFGRLAHWKVLTPLTDDSDEWMYIDEDVAGAPTVWQNRRQSSCFSHDGGKTYYDIDEPREWWQRALAVAHIRRHKYHTSEAAS